MPWRASRAALSARPQASSSSNGKMASMASPMNFRISPPCSSTGFAMVSKYSFRRAITSSRGQMLRDGGEAPEVAVPDRGVDGEPAAAGDAPGQDLLAGVLAHIGPQQFLASLRLRRISTAIDSTGRRSLIRTRSSVLEPSGPARRPAAGVPPAVGHAERQGHIVGDPVRPQLGIDAELVVVGQRMSRRRRMPSAPS